MGCRTMLVAALACAGCGRLAFDPLGDDGGGGTSGRHYRRHFVIENVSSSTINEVYSIRVPLSIDAGKALASRADVRLLRGPQPAGDSSSPGTAREIGITTVNEDVMWMQLGVALAPGAQTEGYIYYGNPDVLGVDGSAFRLFDDFSNGSWNNSWLVQGTPTGTTDGNSIVLGPGDNGFTTNAATAGIPATSVVEVRAQITNPAGPGNYYWMGFQHVSDFATGPPYLNWVGGSFMAGSDMYVHAWANLGTFNVGVDVTQDTAFHTYRIERVPTSTRFYIDDMLVNDLAVADSTVYSIQLRNNSTTNSLIIAWVRARPFVEPEQTVTFDPEELL